MSRCRITTWWLIITKTTNQNRQAATTTTTVSATAGTRWTICHRWASVTASMRFSLKICARITAQLESRTHKILSSIQLQDRRRPSRLQRHQRQSQLNASENDAEILRWSKESEISWREWLPKTKRKTKGHRVSFNRSTTVVCRRQTRLQQQRVRFTRAATFSATRGNSKSCKILKWYRRLKTRCLCARPSRSRRRHEMNVSSFPLIPKELTWAWRGSWRLSRLERFEAKLLSLTCNNALRWYSMVAWRSSWRIQTSSRSSTIAATTRTTCTLNMTF